MRAERLSDACRGHAPLQLWIVVERVDREEPSGLGNDFGSEAVFSENAAGWQAGQGPGDCIGLIFKSWTETEVTFTFGTTYHQPEYARLHKEDEYTVSLRGLTKSGSIKIKEPKMK